jgi:SAM-dependent methyltransferase
MTDDRRKVLRSYDAVADEYATRIYGELAGKPFDRDLLAHFAEEVGPRGTICDLGCGPGQVARFLKDCGADVFGVDLSHEMLREAARLNPDVEFVQGDMRRLPVASGALGGIAAFYSIIHVTGEDLTAALLEMKRALKPGGELLVTFHVGSEVIHLDEWWERKVDVDFVFYEPGEIERRLRECGLNRAETFVREPYEGVEHPSRRAYIRARKP